MEFDVQVRTLPDDAIIESSRLAFRLGYLALSCMVTAVIFPTVVIISTIALLLI